jgi:uncharacterized protein (DUF1501 family)
MSVTVAGQNSFQVGQMTTQFAVNSAGAAVLSGTTGSTLATSRYATQQNILSQQEQNLFEAAFGGLTVSSIANTQLLNTTLAAAPALATAFPATGIGPQMKMIAKMIGIAPQLGLTRQIFFASLGGFDLHSDQLTPHATLFQDLSQGLTNDGTAGSDHGWGSHHIIMGGAVNGGDIYGSVPLLELGGPEDTGRGRWIPTTSVDEYSATLASWFGVSASNLPVVLPNVGRFGTPNLGFMA